MNEFQEQLMDHFKNPRFITKPSWVSSSTASSSNITCGDEVEVSLLIKNDIIEDIYIHPEGCSITIGTTSLLASEFVGKEISYISNFSEEELYSFVGVELTEKRKKCALVALEAFQQAIKLLS